MAAATPAQPPATLDQVCEQALKLPCAPSLLPRLISALHDDQSTAAEIERIIAWDSALAAATLRLANSAHFAGRDPVEALDEAILRLGQREIYRLAALILVSRWESAQTGSLRWAPGDYSRHSICTARRRGAGRGHRADRLRRSPTPRALFPRPGQAGARLRLRAVSTPRSRECCDPGAVHVGAGGKIAVLGYHNAETGAQPAARPGSFPELFALGRRSISSARCIRPPRRLPLVAHLHAAKYLAVALGPGVTEEGFLFHDPRLLPGRVGFHHRLPGGSDDRSAHARPGAPRRQAGAHGAVWGEEAVPGRGEGPQRVGDASPDRVGVNAHQLAGWRTWQGITAREGLSGKW